MGSPTEENTEKNKVWENVKFDLESDLFLSQRSFLKVCGNLSVVSTETCTGTTDPILCATRI